MFDKFQARRALARQSGSDASAYVWWYWQHNHHARYRRFVESRPKPLVCQECRGSGGEIDPVICEYGSVMGPWEECGWCEGTGYVTPWLRGQWLQMKRLARH